MKTPIRLIDLTTGYRHKPVTRDINASLHSGELTCLLGPNGAGKSTLLRTLCAFQPPLSGRIVLDGHDIKTLRAREIAQQIGVVLTERPSGVNMTVEELVAIGRSPYTSFFGSLSKLDREVVDRAISLVCIDDLRHRNVQTLSDGERQKALIAKTLAQQTPVIFLDEPTAFLDYPSKVDIMKLLFKVARDEDKTVFMSTHDLELALQIADRIWLLDKEHGLNIGVPEDLAYRGLLAEYFKSDGLRFDPTSGAFVIEHGVRGYVTIEGTSVLANLLRKALRRIGILDGTSDTIIKVSPDTILFDANTVTSIEDALSQIKKASLYNSEAFS